MLKELNRRILIFLIKLTAFFARKTNQSAALFSCHQMSDESDMIVSEYSIPEIKNQDEITSGTVFIANLALIYLKYKQSGVPFLLTFEKLDEIIKEQYPDDETA